MIENNIRVNLEKIAYPDEFIKHGNTDEIEKKYGLDAKSISDNIKSILEENKIKNINILRS